MHIEPAGAARDPHPHEVLRVPLGVCLGWAVGSVGAAIMLNTFGILLLRFMTDFLGIAAAAAAAMIALSKLYDAAVDPFIGVVSDRWRSPMGRRRPFLLISALLCPLSLLALFIVPDLGGPTARLVYMFAALMGYSTAYAIWSVPYMAMAAEMTDDYRDRSRMISFRIQAGTLGQLLAAVCGPWLLVYWGASRGAYERIAVVLATIICCSCLTSFAMTRRARFYLRDEAAALPWAARLRMIWANAPFRWLIMSKTPFFIGSAAMSATNAYFTTYVLRLSDLWLGTYYILLTVATIAAMPLWLRANRRYDKKACLIAANLLFAAACLSWLTAGPGEPTAFLVMRVLGVGLGLGGFILFGQSMLPDTIEYDHRRTGLRREGVFTGVFVLVEKAANALGVALIGLLLGAMGYVQSSAGAAAEQPATAIRAISIAFAVVPALCAICCALLLLPYDLTERKLKSTTGSAIDHNSR